MPVLWVLSVGGRRWPVDPDLHEDGRIVLRDEEDGSRRAHVLTGAELPSLEPAHRRHECSRVRPGPPCRACTFPMDPFLAQHPDEKHHVYHPDCQPPSIRELRELERERSQP